MLFFLGLVKGQLVGACVAIAKHIPMIAGGTLEEL
jgi:hypothetical protein